ncbi:hypothetical protein NE237_021417 [Protea cynaroides]|uniref:Uncharacterized protein n=1 Tax=Protea cynaroides TaxID=273540 RepID=A0A9Q0H7Y0_9MAGN|nr:hypothetical protein NE237_021417 [Protea cynaroides]
MNVVSAADHYLIVSNYFGQMNKIDLGEGIYDQLVDEMAERPRVLWVVQAESLQQLRAAIYSQMRRVCSSSRERTVLHARILIEEQNWRYEGGRPSSVIKTTSSSFTAAPNAAS